MKFKCLHCGYIGNYDMRLGIHKMHKGKKRFQSYCRVKGNTVFMVKVVKK